MKVGIIGAGQMGQVLARHLARLGHRASIASSRAAASLAALAAEVGATPASVAEAIRDAELVVLSIPTKAVAELPPALFANGRNDAIVIDVCNYHPELRDGRIEAIERGLLDSQWVAQQIGRPVIKACNSILATSLGAKSLPPHAPGRVALPVAGDDLAARALVLRLVDELGFDAIDAGTLADSWRQATGAPAYCRDLDAQGLRRALAEAERSRVAEYRAAEEARIKSVFLAGASSPT